MPHAQTETATFDQASGATVPSDGDTENAASLSAANTGFQALANRTQFFKTALQGLSLGGNGGWDAWCTNGTDLKIIPPAALLLGSSLVTQQATQTFTPGGLAANSWYYIYAYISAGVLTFEADGTNSPDVTRTFKFNDASRRYVCTIHTYSAATTIRQFQLSRGLYQYRFSAMTGAEAANFLLVNSAAQVAAMTNVNLDGFVPASALFVDLDVNLAGGTSGTNINGLFQPSGDTGTNGALYTVTGYGAAATNVYDRFPCPVGSYVATGTHRGFAYQYNIPGTANAPVLQVTVTGFRE